MRFSKCCNPLPGDEITGFITRGRGVSIHRTDCPNVVSAGDQKERFLNVQWEVTDDFSFPVEIEIIAMERPNLLTEVMYAVSESKINITAVNGRTTKDKMVVVNLTFVVKDLEQLEYIMNKVRRVKEVYTVRRRSGANALTGKK